VEASSGSAGASVTLRSLEDVGEERARVGVRIDEEDMDASPIGAGKGRTARRLAYPTRAAAWRPWPSRRNARAEARRVV
jgi:hypothetical protein